MAGPIPDQPVNPAALGLAPTNQGICGGPGVLFLKDVQIAAIIDLSKGPFAGQLPGFNCIFSNKKPPSALQAALNGMQDQFKQMAANCGAIYSGPVTTGEPVSGLGRFGLGGNGASIDF